MNVKSHTGWIGVDLDGTLAHYEGWKDGAIGAPIPGIVEAIKTARAAGTEVRILTARAFGGIDVTGSPFLNTVAVSQVQDWCEKHVGERLPVIFWKDMQMLELWDDRAIQVIPNQGIPIAQAGAKLAKIGEKLYFWAHAHGGNCPKLAWDELREALGIDEPEEKSRIIVAHKLPGRWKKR